MILRSPPTLFALALAVLGSEGARPVIVNVDNLGKTSRVKQYEIKSASPEVYSDSALNVHIVPHTHDDVGWLKTVDQYFYGANNSVQHAGVQYIISSVVLELEKDPARRFTYVEMAFFARWFYEQPASMQERVRVLVANKQLSFANGGWCMHDEAAAHYIGMIDQTTLGHAFLAKEFDVAPSVGWQIDPFGHSATQASLLSWASGFDALFFGRIDYQDRQKRQEAAECEGVWRASPSLGDDAQVFWGLTGSYGGNYYGPSSFDWDIGDNGAVPLMDDPNLHGYNVEERVASFTEAAVSQGNMTKDNHIMMTMGGDFQYESATEIFTNLDKLIHYVNEANSQDEGSSSSSGQVQLNVFYSTPEAYAAAKSNSSTSPSSPPSPTVWSVKTGDFFPYADSAHSYWTGYFSSRPLLKRLERATSSLLQASRQLQALTQDFGLKDFTSNPLGRLEAAQAVNQHHDAVSGTAKQHVTLDYAQRLSEGMHEAWEQVVAPYFEAMNPALNASSPSKLSAAAAATTAHLGRRPGKDGDVPNGGDGGDGDGVLAWQPCFLLNESVCPPARDASSSSSSSSASVLAVSAYNPLASVRAGQVLRVPTASAPLEVTDAASGESLEFQVVSSAWSPSKDALPLTVFVACPDVPPLAAVTVLLHFTTTSSSSSSATGVGATEEEAVHLQHNRKHAEKRGPVAATAAATFEVSNGLVTLTFSNDTGLLDAMAYDASGAGGRARSGAAVVAADVRQSWGFYVGFDSGFEGLDLADCDPDLWDDKCPSPSSLTSLTGLTERSHHRALVKQLKKRLYGMKAVDLHRAGDPSLQTLVKLDAVKDAVKAKVTAVAAAAAAAANNNKDGGGSGVGHHDPPRPSLLPSLPKNMFQHGAGAAAEAVGLPFFGVGDGGLGASKQCGTVADGDKQDCGYDGIGELECLGNGCCWSEASETAPWCFDPPKPPDYSSQNSGAYIFRPAEPDMTPFPIGFGDGDAVSVSIVEGPLVTEVRQSFGGWLNQTFRLVRGATVAEAAFSVGPVPVADGNGKEVVATFQTSIKNGAESPAISTDSNGREFLERLYNLRPTWNASVEEPVAGNYYPVNAAAFIKDATAQLSVSVDRSVGAASLSEGALEVMVHRRLLVDDSRGVGEPLNEFDSSDTGDWLNCKTGEGIVVVGTHLLELKDPNSDAMADLRDTMTQTFSPLLLAFKPLTPTNTVANTKEEGQLKEETKKEKSATHRQQDAFEKLVQGDDNNAPPVLPPNVKLVTLQAAGPGALLVRLEHFLAVGEDPVLSQPVNVNLTRFVLALGPFAVVSGGEELTLTANQALEDLTPLPWNTATTAATKTATGVQPSLSALPLAAAATGGGAGGKGKAHRNRHLRSSATAHSPPPSPPLSSDLGSSNSNTRRTRGAVSLKKALSAGGDGVITLNPMEIRTAVLYVE